MTGLRIMRCVWLAIATLLASAAVALGSAPGLVRPLAGPDPHYIYAQDGTCPDGIDVYRVTGTTLARVEHVRVGCDKKETTGDHRLAVVATPAHCLIFADSESGKLYSFEILGGLLTRSPISSVSLNAAGPGDLAVAGSTVFVSNSFQHMLDVATVVSGCVLVRDSEASTLDSSDGSELDYDIALENPTTMVSTDYVSGDMVAYALRTNKTLKEVVNDPGQLVGPPSYGPQGVALTDLDKSGSAAVVFTGYVGPGRDGAGLGRPEVQGFRLTSSGFTPLVGSPATSSDHHSSDGYIVALSPHNRLLLQADGSGQISWYSYTEHTVAYGGDTSLAGKLKPNYPPDAYPTELTVAGDNLIVAGQGELQDCALAPDGVSGCKTIATLTGAGGSQSGSTAIYRP